MHRAMKWSSAIGTRHEWIAVAAAWLVERALHSILPLARILWRLDSRVGAEP